MDKVKNAAREERVKSVTKQTAMEGGKSMEARRSLPAGARSHQPEANPGQSKGEFYVVDDFYSTDDSVAVGPGEELHDGAFNHLLPVLAGIIQGRRLV